MAKFRDRTCKTCGEITYQTASKSEICAVCYIEAKKKEKIEAEKEHLISLNYKLVKEDYEIRHGHRYYALVTPCCNRETIMRYGNILKQLATYATPPCTFCGGESRINKAMSGYVKVHGRNYDIEKFEEYASKVRRLTERTYRLYKHLINPNDFKRGKGANDYHLDHKTSIIFCFKNGISETDASCLANLELLGSKENLKKGRSCSSEIETFIIPQIFTKLKNDDKFEIITDFQNVYETHGKLLIRQSEVNTHPEAVLARVKYRLGHLNVVVGARKLSILEVDQTLEKEFLNKWHVQGYTPSKYCIGLWLNNELISLMSFGAPRYKQKDECMELIRFCSHGEYSVPGGANKLWKHWIKENPTIDIVSYSLIRWGEGRLYEKLGFTNVSKSESPRYFWLTDQKIRSWRASALKAQRENLILKDSTVKINDPGIKTWKYKA